MSGDMSLSSVLGGLRIANPDDSDAPPAQSPHFLDTAASTSTEPEPLPVPIPAPVPVSAPAPDCNNSIYSHNNINNHSNQNNYNNTDSHSSSAAATSPISHPPPISASTSAVTASVRDPVSIPISASSIPVSAPASVLAPVPVPAPVSAAGPGPDRQYFDPPPSHSQLNRVRDLSPASIHRSQQSRYRSSSDPRISAPPIALSRNPSRGRNIDHTAPRQPYVREGSSASFDPTAIHYESTFRGGSASTSAHSGRPLSTPYALGLGPSHDDPRAAAYASSSHQIPSRAHSQRHDRGPPISSQIVAMESQGQAPPRRSSRGMSHHSQNGLPDGFGPGSTVPTTDEEWRDRGSAHGVIREINAEGRPVMRPFKKGVSDFNFAHVLGEGSYSSVYLATDHQTRKDYAIKVLDKRHIIKEKKTKYVNIEKNTLNRLTEHPGIVRLYYTFQDQSSLYYVLDLCNGGELLGALKKTGTFDVECTRFYSAEILDAIDYMHARGVIHRDLKPENVLLDDNMHIKITDFGTAKLLADPRAPTNAQPSANDDRAASFVGTAEYVSPELLMNKSACKGSDLWAFGCMVYQLLAGRPPFKAATEYLTFQKIVNLEYEFPPGFPPAARDLVERLLVLDPTRRLTIDHIKNHEFFDGQYFGKSLWKGPAPRLRPYIPPAQEPNIIQLGNLSSGAPSAPVPSRTRPQSGVGAPRSSAPINELPPPTQIDIDWSPVLTRTNERVLKLGDLMVVTSPSAGSPKAEDGHKKLSRFFGGSATKRKQRLVIITSAGRILMVPAGGDEKKVKQELSLLASDCVWKTQQDAKGMIHWCVDTGGVHYNFEEPKTPSPDNKIANEWIDTLERAKDLALSQASYSNYADNGMSENRPVSPASTLGGQSAYAENYGTGSTSSGRGHLSKNQQGPDEVTAKRNRFSKRQSKSGLGSAF